MKAFISVNKGFGGAEKLFDQLFRDLRACGMIDSEWVYHRYDLSETSIWQVLRSLSRQRRGTVVYNMSVLGIGVLPLLLLKARLNEIILYPHVVVTPATSRPKFWRLRLYLQWLCTYIADHIVAISDGNRLRLEKLTDPSKLKTVYNYVSCENDAIPIIGSLNTDIAVIGRLQDQHKQQLTFLINNRDFLLKHNFIIHLFGTGPDEKKIRNFITENGLHENIIMHGWCEEETIYSYPFGFVLNLSKWEGLPLSILEAIYRDRIVLLSDIDGNRELTSSEFIFKSNDQLRLLLTRAVLNREYSNSSVHSQKLMIFQKYNKMRSLKNLSCIIRNASENKLRIM